MKLEEKYMAVLNEVPNFVTDLTANAGQRTYKYLNLATILKTIKPIFAKYDLAFRQVVRMGAVGDKVSYGTVETIIFDAEKLSPRNRVRFLSIRYLRSSSVHSLSPMPDLSPAPTTL